MNTEIIYYDKFISDIKILHCETINNYIDALRFFIENKNNNDIITYNKRDKFLLFSVGILQVDENDNYYYEYLPKREGNIKLYISYQEI